MTSFTDDLDHLEMIKRRASEYTRPARVESTVETRVIKEDDLFMLTDVDGDIPADNDQGLGVYLQDTRYLSTYELRIAGAKPTTLFSSAEKNCLLSVDLTNPDLQIEGRMARSQTLSINRSRLVHDSIYERITFINYDREAIDLPVTLRFDADFRDIFEVRGYKTRQRRGEKLGVECGDRTLTLGYRGLDDLARRTEIRFVGVPQSLEDGVATFDLRLAPLQEVVIALMITPFEGETHPKPVTYVHARHALETSYSNWLRNNTYVATTSDLFDKMFQRSVLDLRLLLLETEWGPTVSAGTPWFACLFGRDSIITSLQTLMLCPDLARATLRILAHHQGNAVNPWKEEEPGKILHELRRGEMARLDEVPHTPSYATVDATPLWLILLWETFRWTGDIALVDELWEAAMNALEWIDRYGDMDGDGYVEYRCRTDDGLINQGWKDSAVAVFHPDGELSRQPTALVEVQGYVYAAKIGLAELCARRGDTQMAERLRIQANELKERFNRDFWMDDRDFLAFALDGNKRQVRTITSNPGHALWTGIVNERLAQKMIPAFRRSDLLSGWGIRCVSEQETGYNPMGYHLGTVWPHDVSLLIAGLRRYGFDRDAATIGTQLFHAGLEYLYYRFPEVFTGFSRVHNPFPVPYPVACSPQAWAAGTTLLLLQTFLGISPDAGQNRVMLAPELPNWLGEVRVSNLRIGGATLDLRFTRHGDLSTAQVLAKLGNLDVMI